MDGAASKDVFAEKLEEEERKETQVESGPGDLNETLCCAASSSADDGESAVSNRDGAVVPDVGVEDGVGARAARSISSVMDPGKREGSTEDDAADDSDSSCRSMEELLPAHYKGIVHNLRQRRKLRLSQCRTESGGACRFRFSVSCCPFISGGAVIFSSNVTVWWFVDLDTPTVPLIGGNDVK